MQAHPKGSRLDSHCTRRLRGLETQDVDQHEHFSVRDGEGLKSPFQIQSLVEVLWGSRTLRQIGIGVDLQSFRPHEFQEHAPSNSEQPRLDGRIASEANRRSTRAHERLLGELFSFMPISDESQEVRKHRALMGPEYILKLHVCDGASYPLVSRGGAALQSWEAEHIRCWLGI